MTKVVKIKKPKNYDVYIGRSIGCDMDFGNPFSHIKGSLAEVIVKTREESIQAFEDWLNGIDYLDLNPDKRKYILSNLPKLKDKVLGCFCKPQKCHGDILANMADKLDI